MSNAYDLARLALRDDEPGLWRAEDGEKPLYVALDPADVMRLVGALRSFLTLTRKHNDPALEQLAELWIESLNAASARKRPNRRIP